MVELELGPHGLAAATAAAAALGGHGHRTRELPAPSAGGATTLMANTVAVRASARRMAVTSGPSSALVLRALVEDGVPADAV